MATCNWIFVRAVSWVGAVLIICTFCIGTAFGALPAGYVPATLLYQTDGVTEFGSSVCGLNSIGNYPARQVAITITEQTKEHCYSEVGASIKFGAPYDCQLNGWATNSINGVPGDWCAKGTINWPSRRWHYTMSFEVATVLPACPLSDGTMDVEGDTLPPLYYMVPDNYQGLVLIGTEPNQYYPWLYTVNYTMACPKPSQYELAITAAAPFIPYGSGIDSEHHVLTNSKLKLLLTKNDQPVAGKTVYIQSDRGNKDQLDVFNPTNSDGVANTVVATRDQPGNSVITSASPDIQTSREGQITWLPAWYGGLFEVTCYRVAIESLDTTGPMVKMSGIPGLHHHDFVHDTGLQGSGIPLKPGPKGQTYIHWVKKYHKYMYETCPRTASGRCAEKGTTAAVGLHVIPMSVKHDIHSHFLIDDGIGERIAEDTGGKVNAYHIDVFGGRTAAAYPFCKNFGVQWHFVKFLSYN